MLLRILIKPGTIVLENEENRRKSERIKLKENYVKVTLKVQND